MVTKQLRQVSESLLAYLNLSASEATVFIDQRSGADALVVHIFGPSASRRVKPVREWQGYPVSLVRDVNLAAH